VIGARRRERDGATESDGGTMLGSEEAAGVGWRRVCRSGSGGEGRSNDGQLRAAPFGGDGGRLLPHVRRRACLQRPRESSSF